MAFVPTHDYYISQVKLPGNDNVYYIKDAEARQWIQSLQGIEFVVAWNGQSAPDVTKIPTGVEVSYGGETYTGTLEASAAVKSGIYLVWEGSNSQGRDIYVKYFAVGENIGTVNETWYWEYLGNTDISIKGLVTDVELIKGAGDNVLGEATTFTASTSQVTFAGTSNDTVIATVSAVTGKLVTTSIKGVSGSSAVTGISSNTNVTASKATKGTDASVSRVTTEDKEATKVTFGADATASKASAGTAVNVVTATTDITFGGFAGNVTGVAYGFSVTTGETLIFSATNATVYTASKTNGTGSITPYTFTDVNVPNVTSHTAVSFKSVSSSETVTIAQYTFTDITASKIESADALTVALPAADPTVVATGGISSTGSGDQIATNISKTTASVVTNIGTATAAAQTITVGTGDIVEVAKYSDLDVNVTKKN